MSNLPTTSTSPIIFFPLALLFSSDGSLDGIFACKYIPEINYKWYASLSEEEQSKLFKQHYKVAPSRFAYDEIKLRDRCNQNGVDYTPPHTTDSVEQTKLRRYTMNRAIRTIAQKQKRKDMSGVARASAIYDDIIRRRKRQYRESSEVRQQRREHEAMLERHRKERAFERECEHQGVEYKPPENDVNETIPTKKARRKKLRRGFTRQQQPKAQKKKGMKCVYEGSAKSCNCSQPPVKEKFAVRGEGGWANYASSNNMSSCDYISTNTTSLGAKNTCYWERYKPNYTQHVFSLNLNNTQPCSMIDVLQGEIWINGKCASRIMHCMNAHATINGSNLIIKHYYNPLDSDSDWDWEEKFSLEVVCTLEPPDVIEQAKKVIEKWGSKKGWNGHHLYKELNALSVEFRCIVFEEFSMRQGSPIYNIARDTIHNNNMTKKYGPDWMTTWKEIEREKKRKELAENKRKYWMCVRGRQSCHEMRSSGIFSRNLWCSTTCKENRYREINTGVPASPNRDIFTACIDGYLICHDGIIQCPGCRDAKRPRNQLRWRCSWCKEYLYSLTYNEFEEHQKECRKIHSTQVVWVG